ncbi:30S ribosomal protein S6 [Pelagibacteraceae bacterium]|nr:30S ribosomal protein S6 [Pelagibacteraceae bacterium]|tara:strand:- start:187 stop:513 length:327 start_codon:yes stop_codon:yes gene_type:complete
MNKFEVVLLFNPELATNTLNSEIENFKSKLSSKSAKIVNEENWGLRELSYSINKFKKAFYNFIQIEASGHIIKELNKELNQSENLIRYIFIKVNEHQELPTKLNYEKK